jgi:hypothetical protein
MVIWPSHPSPPRPRSVSAWPPEHASGGPSSPASPESWHGQFAYVTGQLPDGTTLPLCRLRYADSASTWGFAIYRASHDDYETSVLPSGYPAGTPRKLSTAPAASTSAISPRGSPSHPN